MLTYADVCHLREAGEHQLLMQAANRQLAEHAAKVEALQQQLSEAALGSALAARCSSLRLELASCAQAADEVALSHQQAAIWAQRQPKGPTEARCRAQPI